MLNHYKIRKINQLVRILKRKEVDDKGKTHLIERIESRNGIHTIEAASELRLGNREYELITIK